MWKQEQHQNPDGPSHAIVMNNSDSRCHVRVFPSGHKSGALLAAGAVISTSLLLHENVTDLDAAKLLALSRFRAILAGRLAQIDEAIEGLKAASAVD